MSQTELISQRKPWILVSTPKEFTSEQDIERVRPQIGNLLIPGNPKGE
jgi:hypothetical protein